MANSKDSRHHAQTAIATVVCQQSVVLLNHHGQVMQTAILVVRLWIEHSLVVVKHHLQAPQGHGPETGIVDVVPGESPLQQLSFGTHQEVTQELDDIPEVPRKAKLSGHL